MALGDLIKDLYDHEGRCERIKNFPFPRQYASLNLYFVWIFIVLLPFGLIQELGRVGDPFVWLAIPFGTLLSWIFYTMEQIGDYSENPFEGLNNDVQMTSIVRTLEIDLLQMLDEPNVPNEIKPVLNVLM
jgi:putative membrane protein